MVPFFEHKTILLQARRKCEPFSFPLHLHDGPEFIYINKGILTLNLAQKKILLHEGDFALIFPYTIHGYECEQSTEVDYSLAISRTKDCGEFKDILSTKHPSTPLIPSDALHSDIIRIMNELTSLDINKTDNFLIHALIQLLLARALPCLKLCDNTTDLDLNTTIKAVKYVTMHYTEQLTLDSVASVLKISRFSLSRIFNEQIHAGFTEYINYLRIEYVKKRLLFTDDSILEIALDAGYNNLRTFNRVFKKSVNTTPLQFRKQNK